MLHLFKKSTALLLAISLLIGSLCLPAFAVEEGTVLDYIHSTVVPTEDNNLFPSITDTTVIPEAKEGYTHVILGDGNFSNYLSGFTYRTDSATYGYAATYVDENGNVVEGQRFYPGAAYSTFNKRGLVFDGIYLNGQYVTPGNGLAMKPGYTSLANPKVPVRWATIEHFIMADTKTGALLTTYCVDQDTPAVEGYYYNIENLEDATYYTEAEAAMIRTIAMNGYWGTPEGFGSLASLKATLLASGEFTEEEVALLNDGMAMTATQYALWSFSNRIKDSVEFVQVYYDEDPYEGGDPKPNTNKAAADLIFKLFYYFTNMDPTPFVENTTGNTILNKDNFMKDLKIHANALAVGHPNNLDEDHSNDAYLCDLSFKMIVSPDVEQDDLVVAVRDYQGNLLVMGRIAGELQDGEIQLVDDGTGRYTFKNIILTEGTETLDITLDGTQELNRGVYLYTSEVIDNVSSQTMVGVAEGTHKVDVDLTEIVEFSVENVQDAVVIDYGRPVDVNPAQNTAFYGEGTLAAISANGLGYTDILYTQGLDETFGTTVEGKYGLFTIVDGKIRYELYKEEHMLAMPEPDVAYYAVEDEDGYYYGKLTVIPATILYYEDDFINFTDTSLTEGTNGTGIWEALGEQAPDIQSEDRIGISENVYGYDPMNKNYTRYSNGMAQSVTVNSVTGTRYTDENGNFTAPTATFTFTGTGFDLISLTTTTTDLIQVIVTDAVTGEKVITKMVDNYYGYKYGKMPAEDGGYIVDEKGNPVYGWYVDQNADGCVWQVPVIKIEGLEYGTYNVTILVAYMTAFDHNADKQDTFVLDAIRIYDPALNDREANEAYWEDGEYKPVFKKLRDLILQASSFDYSDTEGTLCMNGIVFVDGKAETNLSMDYANPGPNNDTYLAHGQSVSFKLNSDQPVRSTHIGVKLAFGESAILCLNGEEFVTVTTATDMYYVLLDESDWNEITYPNGTVGYETDVITLTCVTNNSVISMTNLKFTAASEAVGSIFAFVDDEVLEEVTAVSYALFRSTENKEPEPEAPAEPEIPAEPETEAPVAPEKPAKPEKDEKPAKDETPAKAPKPNKAPVHKNENKGRGSNHNHGTHPHAFHD